jgi:hypothetical protein
MNERIRELITECETEYSTAYEPCYDMEKFAELMVKECAGIYSKIDNGNLHMGTDNYLEALQKHFGVEE